MCFFQLLQEGVGECATKTTRWQGRWCIRSPAAQSHRHRGRNSSNCLRSCFFCLHLAFFLEIKKKKRGKFERSDKRKKTTCCQVCLFLSFWLKKFKIGFYLCPRLNLAKLEHLNLIRGVMINMIRRKDSHTCLTSSQLEPVSFQWI